MVLILILVMRPKQVYAVERLVLLEQKLYLRNAITNPINCIVSIYVNKD